MGIRLANRRTWILCSAVQVVITAGLRASTRTISHIDAIQPVKHLPQLIVDLEGLEYWSLLLSIHLDAGYWGSCAGPRWRIPECQHETNSNRVQCCARDHLEGTACTHTIYGECSVTGLPVVQHEGLSWWSVVYSGVCWHLFLLSVFFSDEACFCRGGIIRFHNATSGQSTILMVYFSLYKSNIQN
jgi:hypothetical protein